MAPSSAYLLQALDFQFPDLKLGAKDVLSTYAGVRPVVNTGKADPSAEGRDHVVLLEHGLLTVTGGKLTTFRVIALDALAKVRTLLPDWHADLTPEPIFTEAPALDQNSLSPRLATRLSGRYGSCAEELLALAQPGELQTIATTDICWAELRWAARNEQVVHLQDLLLRRTRLGLLVPHGGAGLLPRIQMLACAELGWDDLRWQAECELYLALIASHYSLPAENAA